MIGMTISTPRFSGMADEARQRFMRHTGLPCVVFHAEEAGEGQSKDSYGAKFQIIDLLSQTVVFFDADLWFIRPTNLRQFDDAEEFLAVRDPGIHDPNHFPFHDAKTLNLDLMKYFNSGFFICNARHRKVFETAKKLMAEPTVLKDFGEQSYLNAGAQRTAKVRLLPNTYNYCPFGEFHQMRAMVVQTNPMALHAAGYHVEHKWPALQYLEARYLKTFEP